MILLYALLVLEISNMTEKLFVIKNADNTIRIMCVVGEPDMDKVLRDYLATGKPVITLNDLKPIDRINCLDDKYFRDAWRYDGQKILVDMPSARIVHMNNLKVLRDQKLKDSDIEYLKADETNDSQKKQQISSLRQQLRDMPITFDLSIYATPEILKMAMPEYL